MPGSPASNGGAIFQCSGKGYNQPQGATYCCETGVNAKDSCCSGSTFSLAQGFLGSKTVAPAPKATDPPPVKPAETTTPPAPKITDTTTVIAGSTYTVPCTTQGGSIVVLWPSTLSCNVGCPMGPTGPVTSQPTVTPETNVAGVPSPSSTETGSAVVPTQSPPEPPVPSSDDSSSTTTSSTSKTTTSPTGTTTTPPVGGNGDSTQPILVPNAASPLAASLAMLLATAMACIAML